MLRLFEGVLFLFKHTFVILQMPTILACLFSGQTLIFKYLEVTMPSEEGTFPARDECFLT